MPSCVYNCPIVLNELRKKVYKKPCIQKEQIPSKVPPRIPDRELDRDDQRQRIADQTFQRRLDADRRSDHGSRTAVSSKVSKLSGTEKDRSVSKLSGTEKDRSVSKLSGTEKDRSLVYSTEEPGVSRQYSDINGKRKVESATQSLRDGEGIDGISDIDIVKRSVKSSEHFVHDESEITGARPGFIHFESECKENCPERISQKNRLRKLEERQEIVDTYLLNKGMRYFDDVCTCSLSCIIYALKQDSFVRSTIASLTLFTFGLKLCLEFNAWYMPIRHP